MQLQAQLTMARPTRWDGYLGVAVLGVAVLGAAVLQPGARIQPSPGLRPDGMDTLVWPCWASPCSGPPCCNPERASSPALACAPLCKRSITKHAVARPTHDGPTRWDGYLVKGASRSMQLQAQLTMAASDGMDTLVWPCWASPCSGPPCCNPVQGGYKSCTKVVQSRYNAGTRWGGTKPVQGDT